MKFKGRYTQCKACKKLEDSKECMMCSIIYTREVINSKRCRLETPSRFEWNGMSDEEMNKLDDSNNNRIYYISREHIESEIIKAFVNDESLSLNYVKLNGVYTLFNYGLLQEDTFVLDVNDLEEIGKQPMDTAVMETFIGRIVEYDEIVLIAKSGLDITNYLTYKPEEVVKEEG